MRFEKLTTPLRVRLLQVLGYIAASIVTGILIFAITFRYIDSPKEKLLRQQNDDLKQNYKVMEERIKQLQLQMDEIANRDNYVYRSIFESNPIPDSARVKEMEKKKEVQLVQSMGETELVNSMAAQLNNLSLRMAYQVKSFGAIENMGEIQGVVTYSVVPTSISSFNCVGESFEVEFKINSPLTYDILPIRT